MEKQTLVESINVQPDVFLEEITHPSIELILLGEEHFEFYKNAIAIMSKLEKDKQMYQIAVEYFNSRDLKFFDRLLVDKDKDALMTKIKELYPNYHSCVSPILEFSLDHQKRIIPISLNEGGDYDDFEKDKHMVRKLNEHMDGISNEIKTIAIIGDVHLREDREILPNLYCPVEKRVLISQLTKHEPGITKILGTKENKYNLNTIL